MKSKIKKARSTSAKKVSGIVTALVTPFKKGELDLKSFVKLIHSQLDQGVQGFVINGTTAESPTLTPAEVKKLFTVAKTEVAGAVPLIVGTGSNSTAKTAEFSKLVSGWKPDAVLVVVPYYNRPPQRGQFAHFQTVARASRVPLILYNVPSRTVAGLEAKTIAELSRVKNISGIKEATGNMDLLAQVKSASESKFTLLSGDDATWAEFCSRGGHGVISVCSHLIGGEMVATLQTLMSKGTLSSQQLELERDRAQYADLMKWLYIEANPIPVKMALYWMGILSSPELRLPLVQLDEKFHKDFQTCLKNLGKI